MPRLGKHIKEYKSKYYRVYKGVEKDGKTIIYYGMYKATKAFKTERESALFVDKMLINDNKEPRNILKKTNY